MLVLARIKSWFGDTKTLNDTLESVATYYALNHLPPAMIPLLLHNITTSDCKITPYYLNNYINLARNSRTLALSDALHLGHQPILFGEYLKQENMHKIFDYLFPQFTGSQANYRVCIREMDINNKAYLLHKLFIKMSRQYQKQYLSLLFAQYALSHHNLYMQRLVLVVIRLFDDVAYNEVKIKIAAQVANMLSVTRFYYFKPELRLLKKHHIQYAHILKVSAELQKDSWSLAYIFSNNFACKHQSND